MPRGRGPGYRGVVSERVNGKCASESGPRGQGEERMASCLRVSTCPLFAQLKMKSSLRVWKTYYCEGDFDRCARYRLVQAKEPVPLNLLPNGKLLDVPLEQLEPVHFA